MQVGDVSTGRICFNFMGSCCEWYTPTKVKKCSGFYVYQLPPTSYCDLQYCGDGATGRNISLGRARVYNRPVFHLKCRRTFPFALVLHYYVNRMVL